MKKKREEHIVRVALMQAGVEITEKVNKAISKGLREIRREKFTERASFKRKKEIQEAIASAAAMGGSTVEAMIERYEERDPDYAEQIRALWNGGQEGRPI